VKPAIKTVNLLTPEHEHEFEAEHGLPEVLPAGETLLWQGSPDALLLARQALHLDVIGVYFGALLAWRGIGGWYDGMGLGEALVYMSRLLPLFALALGLLGLMAWLMARTSVYSITNRRVVMRVGVVLNITFNLPYAQILTANLRPRGQGRGDIVLGLGGEARIAYVHLWPHVRPWQLKHTQPMLRALTQADEVARILAHALSEAEANHLTAHEKLPLRAVPARDVPMPARAGLGLPARAA
jgi:hypothetical protein